ncbi:receptor-like protein kinase ANXUR2, partial [Trifolium medium]|nr:receptor-like protein kinase ANXUR2 [Trifolium medium]
METLFWTDPWLGGLRRVFDLSLNRLSTVAVMSDLGRGDGEAAWSWRRHLWTWVEALLEERRTLLSDIVLQPNVTDQ